MTRQEILKNTFVVLFFFSVVTNINSQNLEIAKNENYSSNAASLIKQTDLDKNKADESDYEFEENKMSGDWGGIRSSLMNNGLDFSFIYKSEYFSNMRGGSTIGGAVLHNFDFQINLDLNHSIHLPGASLFVYFLGNHGSAIGDLTGVVQGTSNIETCEAWKLYEFWFEQNLFDDFLSLKLGLYDLNTEFDSRETSSLFINPSHGIGADFSQSGLNGPSIFPTTSLAMRIKIQPSENFFFQSAIFDGVPGDPENPHGTHIHLNKEDGVLLASEVNYQTTNSFLPFLRLALGMWHYTSKFESLKNIYEQNSQAEQRGNTGIYAFAESKLFGETEDEEQGLSTFIRIGTADARVNQFDFYFGGGLVYKGLINERDEDSFGIAFAAVRNSRNFILASEFENIYIPKYEINLEATYDFIIFGWFNLQPNFQYTINPLFSESHKNSFAAGARITLHF